MTVLTLPLPPSINSYHRSVTLRGGVSKVLISREGRAWKKKALQLVAMQGPQTYEGAVRITVAVYFKDRRRDLDNVLKPTLDLLQEARILANDRQVEAIHAERWTDKGNPRIVVQVEHFNREAA